MNASVEERLSAALAARAEQVQVEDLRAEPGPPEPHRASVVPLRRPSRPLTTALVAAAAAVAVSAPFVYGALTSGSRAPDPAPAPPAPSVSVSPPPNVGAAWPVTQRDRADLDGDGTPDPLRVRADGDEFTAARLRLEVDLSGSGTTTYGLVDVGGSDYSIVGTVDADSDGGSELVLYVGVEGARFVVVDLVEGYLVDVPQDETAPLTTGLVVDREVDERVTLSFDTTRWLRDGTLYSSRSVSSYPTYGMSHEVPNPYVADVWAWRLVDGVLTPQPQPPLCIPAGADGVRGRPCADGEGDGVPPLFPEVTASVGVGEFAELDLDLDGRPDEAALEDAGSGATDLVVTTSSGEQRLRVPSQEVSLYPTTIAVGSAPDGISLLLAVQDGDATRLVYVYTGADGFAGDLLTLDADQVVGGPFGSGSRADGTTYETWVGANSRIYTARVANGGEPGTAPTLVHAWTLERSGGRLRLAAVELGYFCVDLVGRTVARCAP